MKRKQFLAILLVLTTALTVCFGAPAAAYAKTKLTADATSLVFVVGGTKKMRVFANGKLLANSQLRFKSSKKSVAEVDAKGNIKARKAGKATITATLKSNKKLSVKYKLTVKKAGSAFSVTPSSAPLNGAFLNFSTYNKYSKHYYVLRSYMEYFEKQKGGRLRLKKGRYSLPTAIAVPSGVTLTFSDGAVVKKTAKTGSKKLGNSGSMFLLCAPSKQKKKGAYKGYGGVHDVTFRGEGTAVIDMAGTPADKDALAFVLCHNQRITLERLTFRNAAKGHFIELDASKNVQILHCAFENQVQEKADSLDECINIDTPDENTGGFRHDWAKYDKTPNDTVTVSECTFTNVQRGVGAHSYSEGQYHRHITIENCIFNDCYYGAIGLLNFRDCRVVGNVICGVGRRTTGSEWNTAYYNKTRAVIVSGCSGCTIESNFFCMVFEAIRFTPKKLSAYDGYAPTYNEVLTDGQYSDMAQSNYYEEGTVDRPIIRVFLALDSSGSGADKQGDYDLARMD